MGIISFFTTKTQEIIEKLSPSEIQEAERQNNPGSVFGDGFEDAPDDMMGRMFNNPIPAKNKPTSKSITKSTDNSSEVQEAQNEVDTAQAEYNKLAANNENKEALDNITNLEVEVAQYGAVLKQLTGTLSQKNTQLMQLQSSLDKATSEDKTNIQTSINNLNSEIIAIQKEIQANEQKKEDAEKKLSEAQAKIPKEGVSQELSAARERLSAAKQKLAAAQAKESQISANNEAEDIDEKPIAQKEINKTIDNVKKDFSRTSDNFKKGEIAKGLDDTIATTINTLNKPGEIVEDVANNLIDGTKTGIDVIDNVGVNGVGKTAKGILALPTSAVETVGSLFSTEEGSTTKAVEKFGNGLKDVGEGIYNTGATVFGKGWLWGNSEQTEQPDSVASEQVAHIKDNVEKDYNRASENFKDGNYIKGTGDLLATTVNIVNKPGEIVENVANKFLDNTETGIEVIDNIGANGVGKTAKGILALPTSAVETIGSFFSSEEGSTTKAVEKFGNGLKDIGEGIYNTVNFGKGWLWDKEVAEKSPEKPAEKTAKKPAQENLAEIVEDGQDNVDEYEDLDLEKKKDEEYFNYFQNSEINNDVNNDVNNVDTQDDEDVKKSHLSQAKVTISDEEMKTRQAELKDLQVRVRKFVLERSQEEIEKAEGWFSTDNSDLSSRQELTNQYRNYLTVLNETNKDLDKLSPEEYAAKFEELTDGISLERYRNKDFNLNYKINPSNISDKVAARKVSTENNNEQKNAINELVEQTKTNLQNMPDYGAVKQLLNDTVVDWFGTSTKDLDKKSNELCVQISELSKLKNDPEAFCAKYKEITGVTFDADKIKTAQEAKSNFENIQAQKYVYDTISDKKLQYVLQAYEQNPEIKTKVVDDFYMGAMGMPSQRLETIDNVTPMKDATLATVSKLYGLNNNDAKKFIEDSFNNNSTKKFSELTEREQNDYYAQFLKQLTSEENVEKAKNTLDKSLGGRTFEKAEEDCQNKLEQAFGKNELAQMIKDNIKGTEIAYGGIKLTAIVATGAFTGGTGFVAMASSAVAAGATSFAIDTTESSTDAQGLTLDEMKSNLKEAGTTSTFVFLGGAANKIGVKVMQSSKKFQQIAKIAKSGHALPGNISKTTQTASKILGKLSPKVAGFVAESTADIGMSYTASKVFGMETTLLGETGESILPNLALTVVGSNTNRIRKVLTPIKRKFSNLNVPKIKISKTDLPKTDIPKVNKSKVDSPKGDTSNVDIPKVDKPKVKSAQPETQKIKQQKAEQQKVQQQKAEQQKVQQQKAEQQKVQQQKAEQQKVQQQKVQQQKVEQQKAEQQKVEQQKSGASKSKLSLNLVDKLTKIEGDTSGTYWSRVLEKKAIKKPVQKQIGEYLDSLLEKIPEGQLGNGSTVRFEADFILPDGTLIARKISGKERIVFENGVKSINNAKSDSSTNQDIIFWIKDNEGIEHILPCLDKENRKKAARICDYLATQKEIPREEIKNIQKQKLEELASGSKAKSPKVETSGLEKSKSIIEKAEEEYKRLRAGKTYDITDTARVNHDAALSTTTEGIERFESGGFMNSISKTNYNENWASHVSLNAEVTPDLMKSLDDLALKYNIQYKVPLTAEKCSRIDTTTIYLGKDVDAKFYDELTTLTKDKIQIRDSFGEYSVGTEISRGITVCKEPDENLINNLIQQAKDNGNAELADAISRVNKKQGGLSAGQFTVYEKMLKNNAQSSLLDPNIELKNLRNSKSQTVNSQPREVHQDIKINQKQNKITSNTKEKITVKDNVKTIQTDTPEATIITKQTLDGKTLETIEIPKKQGYIADPGGGLDIPVGQGSKVYKSTEGKIVRIETTINGKKVNNSYNYDDNGAMVTSSTYDAIERCQWDIQYYPNGQPKITRQIYDNGKIVEVEANQDGSCKSRTIVKKVTRTFGDKSKTAERTSAKKDESSARKALDSDATVSKGQPTKVEIKETEPQTGKQAFYEITDGKKVLTKTVETVDGKQKTTLYNDHGIRTSSVTHRANGKIDHETEYTADGNGRKSAKWYDASGQISQEDLYFSRDNVCLSESDIWKGGKVSDFAGKEIAQSTFYKNGKIELIETYAPSYANNKSAEVFEPGTSLRTKKIYDAKGNSVEEVFGQGSVKSPDGKDISFSSGLKISRDDNNNIIRIETRNAGDSQVLEYSPDGTFKSKTISIAGGTATIYADGTKIYNRYASGININGYRIFNFSKNKFVTTKYNADGKIESVRYPNIGAEDTVIELKYDGGKLTKVHHTHRDGKIDETTYDYDEFGNRKMESVISRGADNSFVSHKAVALKDDRFPIENYGTLRIKQGAKFEYDANGNVTKIITPHSNGKTTQIEIVYLDGKKIQLVHNHSDGSSTKVHYDRITGKESHRQEFDKYGKDLGTKFNKVAEPKIDVWTNVPEAPLEKLKYFYETEVNGIKIKDTIFNKTLSSSEKTLLLKIKNLVIGDKSTFRNLSINLHPDKPHGDEELFKFLSALNNL